MREDAPHPPFGHLLPASGAKGNGGWASLPLAGAKGHRPSLPLAPLAGRGWREAPGEGLFTR